MKKLGQTVLVIRAQWFHLIREYC